MQNKIACCWNVDKLYNRSLIIIINIIIDVWVPRVARFAVRFSQRRVLDYVPVRTLEPESKPMQMFSWSHCLVGNLAGSCFDFPKVGSFESTRAVGIELGMIRFVNMGLGRTFLRFGLFFLDLLHRVVSIFCLVGPARFTIDMSVTGAIASTAAAVAGDTSVTGPTAGLLTTGKSNSFHMP